MTAQGWQAVAVIALVLVSGWYATARAALDRMTVARAARLVEEDRASASRVAALLEDSARTWAALTLLVVVPLVTAVAMMTAILGTWLNTVGSIAVAALVMTILGYVGMELVPRSVALRRAEDVACRMARSVTLASTLLRPVTTVLVWLGARIVPGAEDGAEAFVTEEAIRDLIDEAEGQSIEPAERAMIHSIFELSDTLVREIMVPRPDVVMVSELLPLGSVVEVILANGYSRIPVHRGEDRDDVSGVLYAKDVLQRIHTKGTEDGDWTDLIREPYVVPELKSVDGLLRELQAEQVHMAVVVDEYGALAGIVTIEDVLEEIVGEIIDEYDSEEPLVEMLEEGRWRVDARLQIGELSDLAGTTLPAEEWDTVGGLLFGTLGHVPRPGEAVEVDGLRLTADRVRGRRIAEVTVERIMDPEAVEAAEGMATAGRDNDG
ncbi:MAG: hemolysin family protein [Actinomycetota bacterium]|uniref:hemolysin family protein n=1 Tax=Euzebya pacifica TaxID=1608957 RepID=UPI0030F8D7FC